jgi:hypothetical protein
MTKDLFTGEEREDTISSDWTRDLIAVLKEHKEISLETLYSEMYKLRQRYSRSWPDTAESTIRCMLQRHSREHPQFQGQDLFQMVIPGVWRLRD